MLTYEAPQRLARPSWSTRKAVWGSAMEFWWWCPQSPNRVVCSLEIGNDLRNLLDLIGPSATRPAHLLLSPLHETMQLVLCLSQRMSPPFCLDVVAFVDQVATLSAFFTSASTAFFFWQEHARAQSHVHGRRHRHGHRWVPGHAARVPTPARAHAHVHAPEPTHLCHCRGPGPGPCHSPYTCPCPWVCLPTPMPLHLLSPWPSVCPCMRMGKGIRGETHVPPFR